MVEPVAFPIMKFRQMKIFQSVGKILFLDDKITFFRYL